MDWEWEFKRKGDVRFILTKISPDAAAIIGAANHRAPNLQLRFSSNRNGGVLRWATGVPSETVRAAVEAEVEPERAQPNLLVQV